MSARITLLLDRILARMPAPLMDNPSHAFLAFLCVVSGLPYVFGVTEPNALDALLPQPIVMLWGAFLVTGGGLTLVGTFRGDRVIERAGLRPLGWASFVYSLALLTVAGYRGLFAASVTLVFAMTCGLRVYATRRAVTVVREAESDG